MEKWRSSKVDITDDKDLFSLIATRSINVRIFGSIDMVMMALALIEVVIAITYE